MADPSGFLKHPHRQDRPSRPVPVRIMDFNEVYERQENSAVQTQAGRCMDCGVAFCHTGCPLGNLIPEWNDLVWSDRWEEASQRLHMTNNFPEFTGRVCPAPCETSCVLGINQQPVTIKQSEVSIADEALAQGHVKPVLAQRLTGKTVAVVGSGPAGLAAAQQLTRAGHTVAVYERDDRLGGLLRYGIPDFKMEKHLVDFRIDQMQAEGTRFYTCTEIGADITWQALRDSYDVVVLATGAMVPRDLQAPGRGLEGVHYAMEYLVESNRALAGDDVPDQIHAEGKHVLILGGGDTGADCIGTAHRHGATSVTTLAIGKVLPQERAEHEPWPMDPRILELTSADEEGGERRYLASTVGFLGDENGRVRALRVAETQYNPDGSRTPKPGTETELRADLVLLALGFTGPEQQTLVEQVGVGFDAGGSIERTEDYQSTAEGVFVVGDAGRGASLVVWAIAEGRSAAKEVDEYLEGSSRLPAAVTPGDRAISL
ncbi:glutamate synthase subunit beta [Garicola koreensis]|uniref:Glutamate synthase (NADPH/NADH) small chain n=1 Tax=Garicola koreensis TaxID=1262554 RepID=A0A7W5TV85_9MICC|nr:glutamate synthase subunit beta [Garicola koreensis]MBB3668293.1 glutamate synthase (NADPH/NADH) small chain [Garicola koreensis]